MPSFTTFDRGKLLGYSLDLALLVKYRYVPYVM